jgi:hypothetical protein
MLSDNITNIQPGHINKVLDVKSLANGVYLLQIKIDDGSVINRRVVVQK